MPILSFLNSLELFSNLFPCAIFTNSFSANLLSSVVIGHPNLSFCLQFLMHLFTMTVALRRFQYLNICTKEPAYSVIFGQSPASMSCSINKFSFFLGRTSFATCSVSIISGSPGQYVLSDNYSGSFKHSPLSIDGVTHRAPRSLGL